MMGLDILWDDVIPKVWKRGRRQKFLTLMIEIRIKITMSTMVN